MEQLNIKQTHMLNYKTSLQDKRKNFNNYSLKFSIKDKRKVKRHILGF